MDGISEIVGRICQIENVLNSAAPWNVPPAADAADASNLSDVLQTGLGGAAGSPSATPINIEQLKILLGNMAKRAQASDASRTASGDSLGTGPASLLSPGESPTNPLQVSLGETG